MTTGKKHKKPIKTGETLNKEIDLHEMLQRIEKLEMKVKSLLEESAENSIIPREVKVISFEGIKYDQNWSWIKKISYVLYHSKASLQITQISEELEKIDERFPLIKDKIKSLSTQLYLGAKYKTFYRFRTRGFGAYFYCYERTV